MKVYLIPYIIRRKWSSFVIKLSFFYDNVNMLNWKNGKSIKICYERTLEKQNWVIKNLIEISWIINQILWIIYDNRNRWLKYYELSTIIEIDDSPKISFIWDLWERKLSCKLKSLSFISFSIRDVQKLNRLINHFEKNIIDFFYWVIRSICFLLCLPK